MILIDNDNEVKITKSVKKWLSLDLHIHSQYSAKMKKNESSRVKEMSAKEMVNILMDKGIEIFSITDHNYFSSAYYDEICDCIGNINMSVIYGSELDAYCNNERKSYIHICVYFDTNINTIEIENAISDLYKNDGKPTLYEIINKFYESNFNFIIIPHGDKTKGIFEKGFLDNLNFDDSKNYYKYAMYKIFKAYDIKPNKNEEEHWAGNFFEKTKEFEEAISGLSDEEIKTLENKFSKKIKGENVLFTKVEELVYEYVNKYSSYFSYFSFSDWHNKEEYKPNTGNFIFGSLDLAFESLELATLDPKSRIIKEKTRNIAISNSILKSISFKIRDEQEIINFTPGLNVIIGKRGSGKSLLISIIKYFSFGDNDESYVKYNNVYHFSNIHSKNTAGIELSSGSLGSVAILDQNAVKNIFDDPSIAQENIKEKFLTIEHFDMTKLDMIYDNLNGLKPYNKNYKDLASYINSTLKIDGFIYNTRKEMLATIETNSKKINLLLKSIYEELLKLGLNVNPLLQVMKIVDNSFKYYLKIIELYNEIFIFSNDRINEIKNKQTNNNSQFQQLEINKNEALSIVEDNFNKQICYFKIKSIISNYEIEDIAVKVRKEGKYLFCTYYSIPENIKEEIIDKIIDKLISPRENLNDIALYLEGRKRLKANANDISTSYKEYIESEIFKPKYEFYEIINDDIDYEKSIKTKKDLVNQCNISNITNLTNSSPGIQNVAYLNMLFDLDKDIIVIDQPEDDIDNDYISNNLVPIIKKQKKNKQLIFVTHNPSVAVYGDAFNYIFVSNDGKIKYENYEIEKVKDKDKIIDILDGGRASFSNRNMKYGNILGELNYGNKKKK